MADSPHPHSIEHRCLEYCYTKLGRSTGRSTPPQLSIDALNTTTPNLADVLADLPPSHSSTDALNTTASNLADLMADLPPTPCQLSIDALNTATPNLADLLAQISGKPLHQISFIYSTMHIYPLQMNPCTPLLQSSRDLWKTITPNRFHIYI